MCGGRRLRKLTSTRASDGTPATSSFTSPDAYDRHVGRYSPQLARGLIGLAEVRPGQRALDVGCGPGALTAALAEVVGAGEVAAVDPSVPFVEACRGRVPGADVRVASAEALPFGDDTFDAVLSQLVINFIDAPAAGVREMARVARRDGVVAAAVWDYGGGMTLLRAFWDAARHIDPEGGAARDEGAVMRHATPPALTALWSRAGLRDIATGELHATAQYEDFAALWAPLELGVGPAGAYAAALDDQRRAALRDDMHGRLGAPSGPFTLSARAWTVIGRASATSS